MDKTRFFGIFGCLMVAGSSFHILGAIGSNIPIAMEEMFNRSFQDHYGSYLSPFGISTIWSINSYCINFSTVISLLFVVPLLDTRGARFIAVEERLMVVSLSSLLLLAAFYLPSFECLLLASFILELIKRPSFMATTFYLNDICPNEYRALTVTVYSLCETFSSILSMNLSRPTVFGSAETWVFLPIIALLAILLPSIPLLLQRNSKGGERTRRNAYGAVADMNGNKEVILLRQGEMGKMQLLKDVSLRKLLLVMTSLQLFADITPKTIELYYFTRVHELMGFNQDTIMTIGTIQRIVFIPVYYSTTVALKKYGSRFCALAAIFTMAAKALVTLVALLLSHINGPSILSQLLGILGDTFSGIYGCFGYTTLLYLILYEMTPIHARTAIAQVMSLASLALYSIFFALVPYAFNFFPPLPYSIMLAFYPFLILYLYRNLPYPENRSHEEVASLIH